MSLDDVVGEETVARMAAEGRVAVPTLTMMEAVVRGLGRRGDSYAAARDSVAALHTGGVPILAGTDAQRDSGRAGSRLGSAP